MSAASGITLAPINMSLLKTPAKLPSKESSGESRYVAPNKRTVDTSKVYHVDYTDANFPSLGVPDMEVPVEKKIGFKQTILNLIEKDTMDEVERNKKPEVDLMKMSNTELTMNGWVSLPLNAKEVAGRFNS